MMQIKIIILFEYFNIVFKMFKVGFGKMFCLNPYLSKKLNIEKQNSCPYWTFLYFM